MTEHDLLFKEARNKNTCYSEIYNNAISKTNNMKSITAIIPLLVAAPIASGFVVEMFTEGNCGGQSLGQRNVYDNSCGE